MLDRAVAAAVMGGPGAAPPVRVTLLGPPAATVAGREVDLGPPQRRAVLAALVLARGRVVTTGQLVEAVWGAEQAAKPEAALRAHVSMLRRALEPDRPARAPSSVIVSAPAGYLVPESAAADDVSGFRALVVRADALRRDGRVAEAVEALRDAHALWVGDVALTGVPGPRAELARAALEEERLTTWEDLLEDQLSLRGADAPVHSSLIHALAVHPHRERLHGLLVRVYQRQGRRAEALAAYGRARERLLADLGVEPGPALRELHRQVLADEPGRPVGRPGPVEPPGADGPGDPAEAGPLPVPALAPDDGPAARRCGTPPVGEGAEPAPTVLPRDHAGLLPLPSPLVGRASTVAEIGDALRDASAGRHDGTVLVRGLPGVGTSAVAVAAAHAAGAAFPGGVAVLGRDADDGAWETALDGLAPGRPVLLLADGVREPEDGARAVRARDEVLRRGRLTGDAGARGATPVLLLAGTHRLPRVRARRVEVAPLEDADSQTLFARQVGDDRAQQEPRAVSVICGLHSGFPQLLVATGGMLASRPSWALGDWVEDLMGGGSWASLIRHGLGLFFTPHYDALGPGDAEMFRLLGRHPFAPVGADTVSAMLGRTDGHATFHLEQLHDRGLVESPRPAAYQVPFLLWSYARVVGEEDDPDEPSRAQTRRMLCHYADAATAAVDAGRGGGSAAVRARRWLESARPCLEALRHEYDGDDVDRLGRALSAYDTTDATDATDTTDTTDAADAADATDTADTAGPMG